MINMSSGKSSFYNLQLVNECFAKYSFHTFSFLPLTITSPFSTFRELYLKSMIKIYSRCSRCLLTLKCYDMHVYAVFVCLFICLELFAQRNCLSLRSMKNYY